MSARPAGSTLLKRAVYHSGLLALARLARQRVRGVVLRYHALTDGPEPVLYAAPDICLPVDAFRLQMAFVKRAYSVVSLDDVGRRPRAGRAAAQASARRHLRRRLRRQPPPRAPGAARTRICRPRSTSPPAAWRARRRSGSGRCVRWCCRPRERRSRRRMATSHRADRRPDERRQGADARPRAHGGAGARRAPGAAGGRGRASICMRSWRRRCSRGSRSASCMPPAGPSARTRSPIPTSRSSPPRRRSARCSVRATRSRPPSAARCATSAIRTRAGVISYFSHDTSALLQRLGFRSATTSKPGALRPDADRFALPRLGVSPRLGPVSALAVALERQRLAA